MFFSKKPYLSIEYEDGTTSDFKLHKLPFVVGSGADSNLRIEADGVSIAHFSIFKEAGGWAIERVGSNPVELNGRVVPRQRSLKPHDEIGISKQLKGLETPS